MLNILKFESWPSHAARGRRSWGAHRCAAPPLQLADGPPQLVWPRSHSGKGRFPYSCDKNLFSFLKAGLIAQGGPPSRRVKPNRCRFLFLKTVLCILLRKRVCQHVAAQTPSASCCLCCPCCQATAVCSYPLASRGLLPAVHGRLFT